jgi:hypothetical protein
MSTAIYDKTAGDLIRAALRDASIVAVGIPIQGEDWSIAESTLNDVLSHWQARLGINLWRETEALLPLNPDQVEYELGPDGDHCFTEYFYLVTSAVEAPGSQSINVDNVAELAAAGYNDTDIAGIELDDGTRHWSEIIALGGGIIAIADPIPSGASIGNSIYVYHPADLIDRPVRILDVRHAYDNTANEMPVEQISRQQYYQIPDKTSSANSVNQWYYSPQLGLGKLSVWPPASTAKNILRFTFVKPQYIPEDQSENLLIPSEWYLPLKWALASELGVTYAIAPERLVSIQNKAASSLDDAMSNDVEIDYFSVQPD